MLDEYALLIRTLKSRAITVLFGPVKNIFFKLSFYMCLIYLQNSVKTALSSH